MGKRNNKTELTVSIEIENIELYLEKVEKYVETLEKAKTLAEELANLDFKINII